MTAKTDIEIDKAAALKAVRAAIRLKHSLRADREIAERLPLYEQFIDNALADGEAVAITPGDILNEA